MESRIRSLRDGETKAKNQWLDRCWGKVFKNYLSSHCFDSVGVEESLEGLEKRKAVVRIQFAHS